MAGRYCLLIGINDYPNVEGADLSGCTNDVALMGSLLIDRFGFPEDGCTVLLDREAGQTAILAAFEDLARRVEKDNVVVCFYAGHGSRIADPHQPERFIESIVPSDSGRGEQPNRDIFDVEIDRWVQRLNAVTPYVTLIFDCCHSGSVTRDPFGEATREIAADLRPPELMFERGIVPDLLQTARTRSASREAEATGFVSGRRRAVCLAACRADELANEHLAREHGSTYRHGALSWFLGRTLAETRSGATWRDVFERLAPALSTQYRRQHPQLEGKVDELIFGTAQIRPASYLRVVVPDGGGLELLGGGAHGVTTGSLWSIRDAGARSLDDGDEIAVARVEAVRVTTSLAQLLERNAQEKIRGGQRAFLRRQQLPAPGLRLAISAPAEKNREAERLAELAAATRLLEVTDDRATADVLVRCLAPRDSAETGTPCPGLGPLAQWTWAAVGRDGRLAVRSRPEPVELDELVHDLVSLARFQGLLALDNTDAAGRLRGRVALRVRRVGAPSDHRSADDSVVNVSEGERVDVEVENRHDQPVWVTIVQLGSDGAIELLMPHPAHATYRLDHGQAGIRLSPGERVSVCDYYRQDPDFARGVEGGLPLHLPAGFPWAAEPGESAAVGFLHLKLFATLEDTDFEFLQQEAVRCDPTHPLQQLALAYHTGEHRRSLVPEKTTAPPEMDWTTLTVPVGIGRRNDGVPRL